MENSINIKFRDTLVTYLQNEEVLKMNFLFDATVELENFWLDMVFCRPVRQAYGLYARRLSSLYTNIILRKKPILRDQYALFLKYNVLLNYNLKQLYLEHGDNPDVMVCMINLYIRDWSGHYVVETDSELNCIYGMYATEDIPTSGLFIG